MARHTLTVLGLKSQLIEAIKVAADSKTTQRIGDGDGLMLTVRDNGTAAWVLRYSSAGKRTDYTLGRWPTLTLQGAREKAEETRRMKAAGDDPATKRKVAREVRVLDASTDTLRKLVDDWVATKHHEASAVYRSNIEASLTKDVLPTLGARAPHTITRKEVVDILRAIEQRGALVVVRRVRMWLRQIFEFGVDDEARPLMTASVVPMGTLSSFKTRKTRSFPAITRATEVPALLREIRKTANWSNRTALLLSAYVFQRPSEIREAVWSEFNLAAGVWEIPAARMKGREDHLVPLSTQVVALLKQHQGVVGDDGWLFPGRKYGRPISEGTLTSRLIACGYDGKHSPHGFRAMARTILDEKLKIDTRFIEKQLSHEVDTRLRGAYNRAEYWDDRVLMNQHWADWLDAQT